MLTMPPEKTTEATWLQEILTSAVPLGQAMALEVSRLDERGVELKLPLAPNVNDKGTAFGGALASAMILAAWSVPRVLLARHEISADLVIGRCQIDFLQPVNGAFQARCDWPEPALVKEFIERLQQRGRASLVLDASLICGNAVAARLSGKYAALGISTES